MHDALHDKPRGTGMIIWGWPWLWREHVVLCRCEKREVSHLMFMQSFCTTKSCIYQYDYKHDSFPFWFFSVRRCSQQQENVRNTQARVDHAGGLTWQKFVFLFTAHWHRSLFLSQKALKSHVWCLFFILRHQTPPVSRLSCVISVINTPTGLLWIFQILSCCIPPTGSLGFSLDILLEGWRFRKMCGATDLDICSPTNSPPWSADCSSPQLWGVFWHLLSNCSGFTSCSFPALVQYLCSHQPGFQLFQQTRSDKPPVGDSLCSKQQRDNDSHGLW